MLATRLYVVLPDIISPEQSGFVYGRIIQDNIFLAQELIQSIRKKVRGGNIVIKLDMHKTYDSVNLLVLIKTMRKFGFGERWIDFIWRLLSNRWYSVLANDQCSGYFSSKRGLRQGDPISPTVLL